MSLLGLVRESCRECAQAATLVGIDDEALLALARSVDAESLDACEMDPGLHYLEGGPEETAAFIFTLDSINFGSGWFPSIRKQPGLSGYFTIASCLTERFRESGPLSPAELRSLDAAACARIFDQDQGNPEAMELMARFACALNELGAHIQDSCSGSFLRLAEQADRSAERLAELLCQMPLFNDARIHDGRKVWFLKRAQICAADLSLAFRGKSPADFADLGRLTIFADNLVPHVLRMAGALKIDPAQAARIDKGELIGEGERLEVELRACAVEAVERMAAALACAGRPICAMRLDHWLWARGQSPEIKSVPRMRCRTASY